MPDADWIAADWGTSRLRVWAMDDRNAELARAESGDGMATLSADGFERALLTLVENWLGDGRAVPVIACGMVGARQGWIEAAYRTTPAPMPSRDPLIRAPTTDSRIAVHIIPGLMQADPPDVMRGEETQIAGFLAARPEFEGVICMPGTHTKWTHVAGSVVTKFASHITGELFALLRVQSVLRHSVGGDGFDAEAFADAVAQEPASLTDLFSIRADDLLNGVPPAVSQARLSGRLIGAEVATACADLRGCDVVLLGEDTLTRLYSVALRARGIETESVDGSATTLAGLIAAKTAWESA